MSIVSSGGTITSGDSDVSTYTWDYRNRLESVSYRQQESSDPNVVHYLYDVYDRLIGKDVDEGGDEEIDGRERYIYDGENVALAFVREDGEDLEATDLAHRYLTTPAVDQVMGEIGGSDVLWYLKDNLGTVRDVALYDGSTTEVVDHIIYDAFGNILLQSHPEYQPRSMFTGREWDADAGLYYYRARWYDPQVGRFISDDPLGFAAGDTNVSRYVRNSPTNYIDPSGTRGIEIWHLPDRSLPPPPPQYYHGIRVGYLPPESLGRMPGYTSQCIGYRCCACCLTSDDWPTRSVAPNAPARQVAPGGFWSSIGNSWESMQLGLATIILYVEGYKGEAYDMADKAYCKGPLGQTEGTPYHNGVVAALDVACLAEAGAISLLVVTPASGLTLNEWIEISANSSRLEQALNVMAAQGTLDYAEFEALMFQADVDMTWAEIMESFLAGGG